MQPQSLTILNYLNKDIISVLHDLCTPKLTIFIDNLTIDKAIDRLTNHAHEVNNEMCWCKRVQNIQINYNNVICLNNQLIPQRHSRTIYILDCSIDTHDKIIDRTSIFNIDGTKIEDQIAYGPYTIKRNKQIDSEFEELDKYLQLLLKFIKMT